MILAMTGREKEAKGKKQCDCILQNVSNSTYTHTWTHTGKQVGLHGPVPLKTRSTWKAGTFQSAQGKRHRHRRPITHIRETQTEHTVPCWITPSSLHSTLMKTNASPVWCEGCLPGAGGSLSSEGCLPLLQRTGVWLPAPTSGISKQPLTPKIQGCFVDSTGTRTQCIHIQTQTHTFTHK